MFLLCSSDFDGSLEESRDDLQSVGYDTPVPLIRSDSYTTLLDATPIGSPGAQAKHLHACVAYANHAQQLALHRAQTAAEPDPQRRAITDWIYWQHLGVLMNDAVASEAPA